ncbi:50S ribosomal protein L31 [Candidatus Dependentiae bacterium]|jgi:large subunit ribosomal protein L31|nr:50S ribosomal protein L31 [Candidatus Dependentiae bacterium]
MKSEIHPQIHAISVRCVCGSAFDSISTDEKISVDICSQCHPYYTGQQKFIDTAGRIEKFQKRFTKK